MSDPVRPARSRRRQSLGELSQRSTYLIERQFVRFGSASDQVQPRRQVEFAQNRARSPPEAVAGHRIAHGSVDRKRHLYGGRRRVQEVSSPEGLDSHSATAAAQPLEVGASVNPTDQADKRARPLARRDFNTARPARVLIRARKPCFLARRRALGW